MSRDFIVESDSWNWQKQRDEYDRFMSAPLLLLLMSFLGRQMDFSLTVCLNWYMQCYNEKMFSAS